MSINVIVALIFLIVVSIFSYQNMLPVQVHFLGWTTPEVPIALVALAAAMIGVVTMYLVDTVRVFQAGRRIRQEVKTNRKNRKEIKELKAEIARLKGRKTAVSPEIAETDEAAGISTEKEALVLEEPLKEQVSE